MCMDWLCETDFPVLYAVQGDSTQTSSVETVIPMSKPGATNWSTSTRFGRLCTYFGRAWGTSVISRPMSQLK